MTRLLLVALAMTTASPLLAQAKLGPSAPVPPSDEEVRATMGIPSTDRVRGQKDIVGFASSAAQMSAAWDSSVAPPAPRTFGAAPHAGVAGILCPHDDYLYAGRVYRQVIPLVTARTVVLVGTFHAYRRFGARDSVVFDTFDAWRAPDGEIEVSPLRDAILARLPAGTAVQSAAMHDSEHSLEALAYWLKHSNPGVRIIPVIVPASGYERLAQLADQVGGALATVMRERGLRLGTDVAVVISSDGVHYGADFGHTPYGEGGIQAYARAVDTDVDLLTSQLAGVIEPERVRALAATFVDPEAPDHYRLTWCGRFAIPFGMLLLRRTADGLAQGPATGVPIAYATSVGAPELPLRSTGLGVTAPANLYHFVGYPAAAFVTPRS